MEIDLQGWHDFFAAEAGASAALAGLLFVSVSINLARILKYKHLPARAGEALLAILSVLIVASFALVPGLDLKTYGLEIGITGALVWAIQTRALIAANKVGNHYNRYPTRIIMNQIPALPFIVAGALLVCGRDEGIYWVVPGTLLSFASGIFGAWVLLIEIQR